VLQAVEREGHGTAVLTEVTTIMVELVEGELAAAGGHVGASGTL
jgi:hypothetical protein